MDYRILELQGPPHAIGRQLARELARTPSPFRRNPWEDDHDFLRACADVLRAVHAPLWEEIAAFADALDLPPERGLFIRAASIPQGCSVLAWRTAAGRVLVGRNYDFYVAMPTRHLLRTSVAGSYAHLGMNGGLVGGRYDGVNERGLFIGLHKVMADRAPHYAPGVPYHLMPRLALDLCASTAEAVALFQAIPQLAPFNYTLADRSGDFARLECYPGLPPAVQRSDQALATTNHYDDPGLSALVGRRPTADSRARERSLLAAVAQERGDPWVQTAQAMSDHATPLCCHKEFGTTLWSGLFDLTGERAAYAFGAPCQVAYREFEWPGA
jgi:hypothetical protein